MAGAALMGLLAAGTGGCSLVSSDDKSDKPVTVGTTDSITSLDPAGAYDAGSWALFSNVYQSLMTYVPGGTTPVPDAAEDCRFTDSGLRVYSCRLRSGLTFGNGDPLTAKDVKFSFDRVKRINWRTGPAPMLSTLESVQTQGEDRVVFHLRTPDATFPFKVASNAGAIVDGSRYPADRLRTGGEADGSGPYTLKRYRTGSLAELKPNGKYHGAIKNVGGPVTVKYFTDSAKLSDAWRQGEVDVAYRDLPPAEIAKLAQSTGDQHVTESAAPHIRNLVFNLRKNSPFAEGAVRQAVASVIDRSALARDVHHRTVEPLYSVIPQGVTGHTTAFYDRYPQPDPDRARRLLKEAGVNTPVHFVLAYSQGGAANRDEVTMLKKQLEATGLFTVDARYADWNDFQDGLAKGGFDSYLVSWLGDYPDPDTFTSLVSSDSAMHSGYASPKVDRLIRAAQQNQHREQSAEEFRTIQKIIAEDVPLLPLWQKKQYVVTKQSISGGQYLTDGTGLWRLWRLGRI
ncbi:ABC transporter substrate-binding protein [Streptomyces orinoci]|uniref:ABC transporter substrate-binding protein n=1 Tax=Streptomyces orinoci TaxID=67339 RepID=A0ABV3JU83_STRON|nr:ABC transporter substrate-binding protein [Streptomyces orinoci]